MTDIFTIEEYLYDDYEERYEWQNYCNTPIFEQACVIMKHMGEVGRKARLRYTADDGSERYFFNYDITNNGEQVQVVF